MCAVSVAGQEVGGVTEGNLELKSYLPFITEGFVSLKGSKEQVRIKILRDTGAFDSFIVAATLPFSNDTFVGSSIPVVGMGLNVLNVPQHKMMLHCNLFQGEVSVGVRPALPVDGVAMILGNDIAGDKVWADVSPPARVTVTPLECSKPDESEVHFPDVFSACAVLGQSMWTVINLKLWPLVLAYSYLLFPGLFLMMSYCMSRKLIAL